MARSSFLSLRGLLLVVDVGNHDVSDLIEMSFDIALAVRALSENGVALLVVGKVLLEPLDVALEA